MIGEISKAPRLGRNLRILFNIGSVNRYVKSKYDKVPGLTVILIGDMAPSQIYVRNKEKSANEVGLKSEVIKYPDTVEEKTVLEKIVELNNDDSVSGILVQLPLPKHIDKQKVIEKIVPSKDVDGFHPI